MLYSNRKRIMILSIIILIFVTMLIGMSMAGADVSAIGQRTIKQKEDTIATDLHFVVYQADKDTSWILGWVIELSVSYTKIKTVPDDWPFSDGKIHSVAIDIEGINVPKNKDVDIIATLILNSYNTVKFKDIEWSYPCGEDNVAAMPADIGWSVWQPLTGSSNGGWLISSFTITDIDGNVLAEDVVGHEYLSSEASPAPEGLFIYNGTPDDAGDTTVHIRDWGISVLDGQPLPPWDDIDDLDNWDYYNEGPVQYSPGNSGSAPPTDAPTTTPTPSPTCAPTCAP